MCPFLLELVTGGVTVDILLWLAGWVELSPMLPKCKENANDAHQVLWFLVGSLILESSCSSPSSPGGLSRSSLLCRSCSVCLLETTTQNIDVHSVCSWEGQAQCPLTLPSWTCSNSGNYSDFPKVAILFEDTYLRPHHRITPGIRIYVLHHAWTQGSHTATCRFTNIIYIQCGDWGEVFVCRKGVPGKFNHLQKSMYCEIN